MLRGTQANYHFFAITCFWKENVSRPLDGDMARGQLFQKPKILKTDRVIWTDFKDCHFRAQDLRVHPKTFGARYPPALFWFFYLAAQKFVAPALVKPKLLSFLVLHV